MTSKQKYFLKHNIQKNFDIIRSQIAYSPIQTLNIFFTKEKVETNKSQGYKFENLGSSPSKKDRFYHEYIFFTNIFRLKVCGRKFYNHNNTKIYTVIPLHCL